MIIHILCMATYAQILTRGLYHLYVFSVKYTICEGSKLRYVVLLSTGVVIHCVQRSKFKKVGPQGSKAPNVMNLMREGRCLEFGEGN